MLFGHAHAESLTTPANILWSDNGTCVGTINGQESSYYGAVAGDNITFSITNSSSQLNVTVTITESGQNTYTNTLLPGDTANPTFPVNSEVTLGVDGANCQSQHGGPAYLFVEAASGSMSCSIANNQVWTVSMDYTGVLNTVCHPPLTMNTLSS